MASPRMIRDTIMLTLMQLVLDSAALIMNSFITQRLGASAVGAFTLMGSFLGLAGILSNGNAFLCTSRLVSEEIAKKNGSPEGVLMHGIKLCMMMSAVVSAAVYLLAGPINSRFFSGNDMQTAVRVMPLALVAGAVSACIKGYFNACRRPAITALSDIAEFAVRSGVIIIMTLFSSADSADICRILVVSMISGNFTSMLMLSVLYIRKKGRSSGKCSITMGRYARYAFPIMIGSLLTAVLGSTNDALIPVCLRQNGSTASSALAQFGIFEAIVIPTLFFPSVVLCSVSGIIVSESARASAAGNKERIRSITLCLVEYTIIYAVFASALLIRFGRNIGALLGGGIIAGDMIRTIAPIVPFIYMEIVLEALIKGMGLQGFSSLNYFAEYVIRISAVLILVPRIGFYGIAVSYYASNIYGNTMRLIKVMKYTGARFRPVKSIVIPVIYAFLTMNFPEMLMVRSMKLELDLQNVIIYSILWLGLYMMLTIMIKNRRLISACNVRLLCKADKYAGGQ